MTPESQRGWGGTAGAEAKLTGLELVSERHFHALFIFPSKSLFHRGPGAAFQVFSVWRKQTNRAS